MNATVTKLAQEVAPARRTRLGLWNSSIGLKLVMALTGVALSGFVLIHMAANLQIFQGPAAMDDYAKLLRKEPALLWTARLVLLAAVGLHIWAYLMLGRKNNRARPHAYQKVAHRESSFASRTMRLTGPLLLAFIIYHILHMTTGTVHPAFQEGSVYQNLVTGLRVIPVAVIYVLAMVLLALHLWHGVWSLFQTLGADQPRYHSLGRWFATVFTVAVVVGFTAVPLAIVTRFIK